VIVVSDTNILSSLAAGESFPRLRLLFAPAKLVIPPFVEQELQTGLDKGLHYLEPILLAIPNKQLQVISLSAEEELLTFNYPGGLNEGERQAIAIAQMRKAILLSNDGQAIRYCKRRNVSVVNLVDILHLFWVRNVMSPDEVREVIEKMKRVEGLALTPDHLAEIFAPQTTV